MKPCQIHRRKAIRWLESRLRRIDAKLDRTLACHYQLSVARCHTRRHELANLVQAAWAQRDGLI